MFIKSRREFLTQTLRSLSVLGGVGAMAKFGEINALAGPTTGYQALVCIFLEGGNDGHNTVIPISTAQQNYSLYQAGRQGMALSQASLLPIANGSDQYGLHPSLPEIQALYTQGKAAVLANVGMLVQPVSRATVIGNNAALLPAALFSHSDQASQWQSGLPNGIASSGWGGRISDAMQTQNAGAIFPPITSTSSCGLFCTGNQTYPASVPPPYTGSASPTGMAALGIRSGSAAASGAQQLLSFDNGLQLVQSANGIMTRGNIYANTLTKLLTGVSLKTQFPANNPLAAQLNTVANVMAVRGQLGLNRQIFFCTLGGFDTHGGQLAIQQQLLQQLSQAVGAFYIATQELGVDQDVTTFTASEFGRTLNSNGTGTDHAWGSHHFIIGGSVKGGQFFGNFPLLALGSSDDANTRGTLIPTTAVDQYGATIAQWFGVSPASLPTVFPNIAHFGSSNLGFMG